MSIRLRHLWRTAVSMWLAIAVSGFAGAKPPDLPTSSREVVAPQAGSQKIEIIGEVPEEKPIQAEQLTGMPVPVERIPFMPTEVAAGTATSSKPARVGEVIIVGNERTRDRIIRAAVAIYPGEVLSYPKLRQAERNLEKLGNFVVDRRKGIRPTVTVLEKDGSEYKDILVQVQERAADRGEEEATAPPPAMPLTSDSHQAAARRMYLIAERCRRKGDLDMAANCYQETHLLCPDCSYGRKAIARLHEIEMRRAADTVPAEAEELPAPKPDHAPSDFETPLPPLPDESVFRDLMSLLDELADAPTAKLLIETEEAAAPAGASEEQEMPATTAPPTLLVPLPPKNLTIYVDEPETYGATSSLLRQAGDVLETMTGLDIDVEFASARSGTGLRAHGSIMLGAVGYKVSYTDEDGHTTLEVVPAKP